MITTYIDKSARQGGGALIEFAAVLPILLALAIGIFYYGYVFMLDAAVDHAAKQGAQVAVGLDPVAFNTPAAFNTEVTAQVNASVTNSLAWLPASIRAGLNSPPALVTFMTPPNGEPGTLVNVSVAISVAGNSSPLLPQINLPGIGSVPPLPPTVNGVAQIVL